MIGNLNEKFHNFSHNREENEDFALRQGDNFLNSPAFRLRSTPVTRLLV